MNKTFRTLLTAMTVSGCIDSGGFDESSIQSEIQTEKIGVADFVWRHYPDPVVMRVSNATPAIDGCSATMIGPQVLMTAAHCGLGGKTATFKSYRADGTSITESFICNHLVHTYDDTDLALWFCTMNNGVAPGDRYGYLDFDTSAVVVGERVFSIWTNPILDRGTDLERLWSDGTVRTTTGTGWFVPGQSDANNLPIGVFTDLWSYYGASGSSQVSPITGKIRIGPTSVGGGVAYKKTCDVNGECWDTPYGIEGPMRGSMSIAHYLYFGNVSDTDLDDGVHTSFLQSLGLDPSRYLGLVDKDRDNLFDVQRDVELRFGESARPHYRFSFDSPRQNILWSKTSFVTLGVWGAQIKVSTATSSQVLRHDRLNLQPGHIYRVTASTALTSYTGAFTMEIVSAANATTSSTSMVSAPNTGLHRHSMQFQAQAGDKLAFVVSGTVDGRIAEVEIDEAGTPFDFDTAELRASWYDANSGRPAMLTPDGEIPVGTNPRPNWAGIVMRTSSRARGSDWPLASTSLPLLAGSSRVCADVAQVTGAPLGGNWGVMRVVSNGAVVAQRTFSVGAAFANVCTPFFTAPSTDTIVEFGMDTDVTTVRYAVDRVTVL